MSAPSADFSALGASTSSSGYTDGLGRRTLAFDREDGTMLERLVVRAELSAFERSLRDRVERVAAMDDERLARPRSIERAGDGSLIVLSEFVPGSRLSDLLDATAQQGSVPGVDVALGFLLDVLPALCGLHAGAGFAHGAISPGRTVLTPAGQVVVLDAIFGDALSHLQYTRRRLWLEFGVAMPPAAGPARFDAAADVAQAALAALMLVIGRPIAEHEYPDGIPALLVEVVDVAQIRGSSEFATGLQRFMQRSLPLPGRRPYTAADDALIDVRDLARELGLDVCRRALLDFIEQQDSGSQTGSQASGEADYTYEYGVSTVDTDTNGDGTDDVDDDEGSFEVDLDLDGTTASEEDTIYDLGSGTELEEDTETIEPAAADAFVPAPVEEEAVSEPVEAEPALADAFVPAPAEPEPFSSDAFAPAPIVDEPRDESVDQQREESVEERREESAAPELSETSDEEPLASSPSVDDSEPEPSAEEESVEESAIEEPKGSRRRKRSRSVRSRKDKLRSTARPEPIAPPRAAAPPPAPPAPSPPAPKTSGGWLVEPTRAASFEPAVPNVPAEPPAFSAPPPKPAPPIAAPPPPPPPIVVAPPPVIVAPPPPPPVPVVVSPPPPARPTVPLAPPIPVQRPPVVAPPSPVAAPTTVKLKAPSVPQTPPRQPRSNPVEDLYAGPGFGQKEAPEASPFPWKIASGALVLLVVAFIVGRPFLSGRSEKTSPTANTVETPAPAAAPAPTVAPKTGLIQVETQPPGAKVFLDGKQVGESPLKLEVPAGRHTLTLAASSGSVRRTVRVESGKTVTVDVPIFSGWVEVAAPIILDVSEGGKSIGTTEQNRLLLPPGRHELTFSNRDLDYTSTHTVEIEPGEARTLTIDPRGTANLNATPWAEVWVDGKKVGDTPLAHLQLPLGTHEVVFKHPEYGERRMTTTIRANAPIALSVDMRKQQ